MARKGAGKILTSDATGLASWQLSATETNESSVNICCQRWMKKNLDVSTYRNGDPIPKVTSNAAWLALTSGAYCYYNNDSATYAATYGKLYNWYAVNDPRGLAPEGWHIPTEFEWITLGACLEGDEIAGGYIKELGTTNWNLPNTGATNISGFTGLPGGDRYSDGTFANINEVGIWWSATELYYDDAWSRNVAYNDVVLFRYESNRKYGFSVRCIRD